MKFKVCSVVFRLVGATDQATIWHAGGSRKFAPADQIWPVSYTNYSAITYTVQRIRTVLDSCIV